MASGRGSPADPGGLVFSLSCSTSIHIKLLKAMVVKL